MTYRMNPGLFVSCPVREVGRATACAILTISLALGCTTASSRAAEPSVLRVPAAAGPVAVAVESTQIAAGSADDWELVEIGGQTRVAAQLAPRVAADGTVAGVGSLVLAVIPPTAASPNSRHFRLQRRTATDVTGATVFKLIELDHATLKVVERDKPVLAYNYGTIVNRLVPETDRRRARACYVHPLWGLDGEVLTDDFPRDHYHHHGVFWAWPHVVVAGQEYDLWTNAGIEQRFVRWLHQETGSVAAVLGVENGWFIGQRRVATERVWMRAFPAGGSERTLDLEIYLVPLVPLSLQGVGGKSYGGLTVRFAVKRADDTVITSPVGTTREDLLETPLAWADLTSRFAGAPGRSGGAIFIHPRHPNFPPTWLTRHYGPLCIGWPGVDARQYEPGQPHRLPYRIWIHAGDRTEEQLRTAYADFTAAVNAQWNDASRPDAAGK